eukprot:scaffold1216_cov357-Prasinococcus_capsulatus_cf.AAC.2
MPLGTPKAGRPTLEETRTSSTAIRRLAALVMEAMEVVGGSGAQGKGRNVRGARRPVTSDGRSRLRTRARFYGLRPRRRRPRRRARRSVTMHTYIHTYSPTYIHTRRGASRGGHRVAREGSPGALLVRWGAPRRRGTRPSK